MEKYIHNPNYRMKYPGKEAYVFSECKMNSFPWQNKDYKKREAIPRQCNLFIDRDYG